MAKAMKKSMKSSMKKATKAMKAKKSSAMKKRKAKKVSVIGKGKLAKVMVFKGSKAKTVGGLKKSDLCKNKHGRVVSKKMSQRAKSGKSAEWCKAVVKARAALKIKGFCAVGGKSSQGKALLAKARSFYKK